MKPPYLYITHGDPAHVIGADYDPGHDDALIIVLSSYPGDVVRKEAVTKLEPGDKLTFAFKLEYFLASTVTVKKGDTPHSLEERAREARIDMDPVVAINDCNVYHESTALEEN